jgi:hypothetical protein
VPDATDAGVSLQVKEMSRQSGNYVVSEPRHPLEEILEEEREAMRTFATRDPEVWSYVSDASRVVQELWSTAAEIDDLTKAESLRIFMWQMLSKYQLQSFRFIVLREIDAAFTLLRNAAELARVIAYIGDDPSRAATWLKSKAGEAQRLNSKFDKTDPLQACVAKLYDMTCKWGTHGHDSALRWGELTGLVGKGFHVSVVAVSAEGVDRAIRLWLTAFYPMQMLCLKPFMAAHPAEFGGARQIFADFAKLTDDLLGRRA